MTSKRSSAWTTWAAAALITLSPSIATPLQAASQSQIDSAVNRAYAWLDGQYRSACAASFRNHYNDQYRLENGVYRLVTPRQPDDRAFTYDQALAAMAFLQDARTGNASDRKAEAILNQFKALQKSEGSWATAYSCTASPATSWKEMEPFTDVGPTVWVGLAALAYKAKHTESTAYDAMIVNVVRYVSANQWKTQWGGDGGVNFASNRLQNVASTEHNLDVYALLKGVKSRPALYAAANAALTGDMSVDVTMSNVFSFLTTKVWNAGELRFNGGRNDGKFPSDMITWGSAALGDDFNNAYYSLVRWDVETQPNPFDYNGAIDFVHKRERASQGVYFNDWWDYFSDASGAKGDLVVVNDRVQDSWYEGTGQMIAALKLAKTFYAGKNWSTTAIQAKIDGYLNTMIARQQSDGGLNYCDRGSSNTYFRMTAAPSMAGTAWFIFAAKDFNAFYPFANGVGRVARGW